MKSIVVVGASLAGLRAVETLRREGFDGRLTLVGAEPHLPYDRPPLSKEMLAGDWEHDQIVLREGPVRGARPRAAARRRRDRRSTSTRTKVDARRAAPSSPFDGLVIATGVTPRTLPGQPDARRRLHAAHDRRLPRDPRPRSTPGAEVCVIGAGFIGAEVAATCRKRGLDVTVLEALPQPMVRGVGHGARRGARRPAPRPRRRPALRGDAGVDRGHGPGRARPPGRRRAVDCDVLIVAVGVAPETRWLEGSGLVLDDGVVCDETLLAAPGVVAAGDVVPLAEPGVRRRGHAASSTGRTRPSRACTSGSACSRGDGDAPSRSRRCRSSGRTSTT